jgi:hypothetical protein
MHAASLIAVVIAATHTLSANAQIVVAHFMAQNAFSYSQSDWTNDINTAKATGIDGFGADFLASEAILIDPNNSVKYCTGGLRGGSRGNCFCW